MKDALQKVLGAGIGGPAGLSTLQAFLTSWSHACPRGRHGEFLAALFEGSPRRRAVCHH
jgi:hypothetical protein